MGRNSISINLTPLSQPYYITQSFKKITFTNQKGLLNYQLLFNPFSRSNNIVYIITPLVYPFRLFWGEDYNQSIVFRANSISFKILSLSQPIFITSSSNKFYFTSQTYQLISHPIIQAKPKVNIPNTTTEHIVPFWSRKCNISQFSQQQTLYQLLLHHHNSPHSSTHHQ